ncbi:CRISPR-associated protein Cas4 [Desulfonema ishimotonii]|uniref:CRISPR-associated exonuclease Cas4 n=1 Tax=Desulfonema ishimotonii TaxID=45657 RepID=A0A401FUM3_9BACT|nr:CRISPR-associated protein Cas4 [Desulfonema ishimotonii]GBC60653.1 CRISPR-associated protein Cas4 [Desulfonema ishimotonii]
MDSRTDHNDTESTDSDFSVTATHILEYLFCPRFTYFEEVLDIPERQGKRFKVQKGREIHEEVRKQNPDYLRKKFGVKDKKSDVYLSATGIRGIVDEVLFLDEGTAAPLDYKYAEYKERSFKNHRFQLVFYGRLIQENYDVPVRKGFLVYTRSRNKLVEVAITEKMYAELDGIIRDLRRIIRRGFYPEPTKYRARCGDCCYRNICEQVI